MTGIICHHGHSGGGHYTAYALNHVDQEWYEYDDFSVTKVDAANVINSEAYVLFYKKNNSNTETVKEKLKNSIECNQEKPCLMNFYVSKQWLNKLEHFAEPGRHTEWFVGHMHNSNVVFFAGPIDNSDFLCHHGGVHPLKSGYVNELVASLPQQAWNELHSQFGGGPACTRLYECLHCRKELDALTKQKQFELQEFKTLHAEFQVLSHW